jgi:hypothetical protein
MWDGNTVTITNSYSSCMEIILHLLGAPFNGHSYSLWHHVTTLKLVASGNFILNLLLTLLKVIISSQQGAVGQNNVSGKNDEDNIELKCICLLIVFHVHGGQLLSHKESVCFEKQVMASCGTKRGGGEIVCMYELFQGNICRLLMFKLTTSRAAILNV